MSPIRGTPARLAPFVLALALASVLSLPLSSDRAQAADAVVVKVGAALSITGPAAAYGVSQRAGVLAAVDALNKSGRLPGIKLEAIIEDDGSTKEQGIAVFQRFISREKVAAIIGPTLSNTATAVDPLAQAAKVPVIAVSNTAPRGITDIGPFIWRVSLTEGQVIPGALERLQRKLHFKRAALLYGNDDAFTQAGFTVMKAALEASGIAIAGTQTFAKPDRDYNAQLTALEGLAPDILLVSALADNAAGIVTQARQLGWTGPILGGNGFNSPALVKNAGPAAEGVYVGTAWNKVASDPANQAFLKLMAERHVDPDQFCAQAFTGVLVIAEAITQSGYKGGREEIRTGLTKVRALATPLGTFSFLPNRDGDHEPALQWVKDGKLQIVP